jgi:hypothetical protein
MTGEPERHEHPEWPMAAVRAVVGELAAYVTTALAVITQPARFAAAWASGRTRALNPLAFELNAIALTGVWFTLWSRLLDPNPPSTPLWFTLVKSGIPILLGLLAMAVSHPLLRLLGGRAPLRSTLATALYVGGGPTMLLYLACHPMNMWALLHPGSPPSYVVPWFYLASLVSSFAYHLPMLAAVHGISRWRTIPGALLPSLMRYLFWWWLGALHPNFYRGYLSG